MEADVFIHSTLEVGDKLHSVKLTKDYIVLEPCCEESSGQYSRRYLIKNEKCIKLCEVFAIVAEQQGHRELHEGMEMMSMAMTSFSLYTIRRLPKHCWREQKLTFHCRDANVCQRWVSKVTEILRGPEFNRPQHILVFVNPFGGHKKGPKIYSEKISPLFELAHVETDVVVTTRVSHAYDVVQNYDLSKIDGIVTVGGDGMFAEVMNGLIVRWNRERDIDVNDPDYELIPPDIRVGIIPAGSTDTVAYCTTGATDPVTSALHIILGDSLSIDVSAVHHDNQLLRYCVSMLGYGFYGDVLKDSESNRWMGPKRYTWSGAKKFLKNKSYVGEVSYLAGPENDAVLPSPRDGSSCFFGCTVCRTASENQLMALANSDPIRKRNSVATRSSTSSMYEEGRWKKVEGRFIGVNAVTISCKSHMSPEGFSPSCHLGDGYLDLVLVRECSRFDYLRHMTRFQKRAKDQFDFDFVQVVRVKEFKFRPLTDDDDGRETRGYHRGHLRLKSDGGELSVWNCDGEVLEHPAIDVRVHCQLLRLFARGIEQDHDKQALMSSLSCISCGQ